MGRVISTCLQFIDAFSNPSKKTIDNMRRMGREAQAAGKQIKAAGKTISNAGSALTKSITAPIVGVGVAAVKTAADYESAMSNVKAITGATGEDFKKLTQLGKDLGKSTAWSAQECAEAMQYTGMAGWTAKENVEGLKGILDLASASGTDLARTSDIMTDAISAFGYKASDSALFADVMTKACTSANVSVDTLGESYKYCGAIAGTMSYSIDEITTSLAVMGNQGIKGSQAGTTLKNAIANMAAPTKKMKAAMDDLEISITNSDGSMKSWGEVIKNLQGSFKGLTKDQQTAYAKQLFGKESMAGMLAIINTSTDEYNALSDSIKNSGGAAEDAAKTQLDNLNGQLTLLKSALEGAAIAIGDKLLPYIKNAVGWIQKATDKFNGLSDSQLNMIIKIAGVAAAIGPVLLIFGKLVTGVGKAVFIFGKISSAIAKAGSIIGLLTGPAGIAIAVIAAIAVAVALVIKNWDKLKPVFNQIAAQVKKMVNQIMPVVKKISSTAISVGKKIFSEVQKIIRKLMPVINSMIKTISKNMPKIQKAISAAFKKVLPVIKMAIGFIKQVAQVVGKVLSKAIQAAMPVVQKIGQVFNAVFPVIVSIVSKAISIVSRIIAKLAPIFKTYFSIAGDYVKFLGDTISSIFSGIMTVVGGILDFITGVFTGNWKKAWEGVKSIFSGIFSTFVTIAKAPINGIITLINGAIKGFNKIKIPDWVPAVGGKGINIPLIPQLAKGTTNWKGGIVQINEKGGEIVDLPTGSRVYPHDKSVKKAYQDGKKESKGGLSINIAKLSDQIIVREDADIDRIAQTLANKIRDTALNMGVI